MRRSLSLAEGALAQQVGALVRRAEYETTQTNSHTFDNAQLAESSIGDDFGCGSNAKQRS